MGKHGDNMGIWERELQAHGGGGVATANQEKSTHVDQNMVCRELPWSVPEKTVKPGLLILSTCAWECVVLGCSHTLLWPSHCRLVLQWESASEAWN